MGNHHDSIALDWVRGEIQDTLKQGQQALEAYVDNRDDTARLRFCLNYLHQVHGTLQMVELYGAALLTEEMEKLAQAVLNETTANVDEAVEVLMQAILQLPQYLEHLDSNRDDFPLVLLPLLNDLRAARGETLLSDTSLFKPDLSPADFRANAAASQRLQDPKVLGHIRKLRQMYQFALAGVIREADLDSHFDYLDKVIQRVIKLCQKTPRVELWTAAGGFVDTLKSHDNPVNSAVKALLRQLDAELKRLIDEHIDILQQPVPEALFKHLLYYVARANELDTPRVSDLRDRYRLSEALPSEESMDTARSRVAGPGRDAIQSVVGALNEELARLKDHLDLFVRAEYRQNSELEELLPGLQQVANTLAVLGLGIPRRVVTEQIEIVQRLSNDATAADDGALMDIAGALLYVEATLAGLEHERTTQSEDTGEAIQYGGQELSEANSALLRESRNSLEQVKTAIVNFIAAQWDPREIEHVPGLLHSIRGGLQLIPLDRVSGMLASAQRYITDVLLDGKRVPDWQQLDTLADMVTSIEYYLERLAEGIEDNEAVLKIAEDSLRSLGFPVGEEPTWDREETVSEAATAEDIPVAMDEPAPVEPVKASDSDLVDDEILEIFIEEAEEVLGTIQAFYPRLRQNHEDRDALTEVRRAFHTLKGSGRLVGASSIGELAWSVENLLNRVIDQSVKPTEELFSFIDTVIARIPGLIEEFRDGHTTGDVDELIAQAEALSTTRKTGPDSEVAAETAIDEAASEEDAQHMDQPPEAIDSAATDIAATADDDLIDDEILEIFIEEAGEVLDTIQEYLPMLLRQFDDRSALSEVRRAFHTLKGSGRMVGADVVGELAWSVENMLNRIIDGSIFMNGDIAQLLEDVVNATPTLVKDFESRRPASLDIAPLEARANALASGEIPEASEMPAESASDDATPEEIGLASRDDATSDIDEQLVDPVLLEIFESETETHLQALKQFLAEAEGRDTTAYTDSLSRALHTLKGSAHTAGIDPLATIISPLEKFVKTARAENHRADRDALVLLEDACGFIEQGLKQIRTAPQQMLPGTETFLNRLDMLAERTLSSGPVGSDESDTEEQTDPQLVQLFLNEGLDILLDADAILDAWAESPGANEQLDKLVLELRQLARGADVAGLTDVSELADLLERTYAAVFDAKAEPDSEFFTVARAGHEALINMMDQVAAGLATKPDSELLQRLQEKLDQFRSETDSSFTQDLNEIDSSFDEDLELELPVLEDDGEGSRATATPTDHADTGSADIDSTDIDSADEGLDPELVEIFLEEAAELIEGTGERLQRWTEQPHDVELLRHLQRDLHTLKGGARLADIGPIGDLSHELETLFEGLTDNRLTTSSELDDLLLRSHDRLAVMVDAISQNEPSRPAPDLIQEIQLYISTHAGNGGTPEPELPEDHALPTLEIDEEPAPDTGDSVGEVAAESEAETGGLHSLDPELAEIFLEEAGEIIDTTAEQLHQWQSDPAQPELVKELQRELHTLKGGARMADIAPVADIAHEMETLFERIVDGRLEATSARTDVALRAHDELASMVDAIAESGQCPAAPDVLKALRAALSDQPVVAEDEDVAEDIELAEMPLETNESDAVSTLDEPAEESAAAAEADTGDFDAELVGIFLEEAYDLINSTGSTLHSWTEDPSSAALAGELQRDVHTLKGGARMAGVDAIGDLTHVLEDLFERVAEGRLEATPEMTDLLFACHDRLAQMVEQVAAQKPCESADALIRQVEAILAGEASAAAPAEPAAAVADEPEQRMPAFEPVDDVPAGPERDDDLIGIFLDEGVEIQAAVKECLAQWREEPEALIGITSLQQELHTLKGGARLADVDPIADLAEAWSDRLETVVADSADGHKALDLSEKAVAGLARMLKEIEEGRSPTADSALLAALAEDVTPDDTATETAEETPAEPEAVDPEVLEIFLEEAGELLDQIENLLEDWRKEPTNTHFNQELQRALHTVKGGARLAQLSALGDKAHAFETRLIDLGGNEPDANTWAAITQDHDTLSDMVGEIRKRYEATGTGPVHLPTQTDDLPAAAQPDAETETQANVPATMPQPKPQPKKPATKARKPDASRAAQETIRVNAPLLDDLVNLAGETSITRSRLEQQSSDFSHTLDEMAATIERLREQLRRMDIETEAQILFRTEKEHGPDYGEDFDPLEMDRYSSIQQLSRALSESASDLADLRETMSDRTRDTETLLVQQSRINTELQEGLMKTRMNPFSSMVPRLRRIVRQISGELKKKVEFDVRNAEGEMDRNILERMVAPLEHMLRNALDHGIETPEDRRKAGKPETGEITLSLTREGGEVVLRMIDDGAGIRTSMVREKAIKQGMLRADEDLSDREILQFILQPGFSTAAQVTQISGRGVGMDVVASEIKQLGGSLDIDSVVGQGTTFTVRLPFTVSVNRALMVSTGEDFYAIPLNTIEGIVRVSTYELEEYYKPESPLYEYAGQEYRLQYLGSLLHSEHHPKLQGQALPLPVILVRGAEQPMALQVDSLMGSREIVVKSLGPQFTSVRGVSGATILGDGNVVVILDLPAMIRSDILSERQRLADLEAAQEQARREERETIVMVVDDSVTVRKVTSRLLERNGMQVLTAKDGLDAVAQLQDHRPDIILLDIEMPRMDGFEVASFIRHDDTLRDTPICMITSRTGQKHRERALAIGVNEYLGKPFQETQLLETIERLTGNN